MKIYTSNFASLSKLPSTIKPIAIVRYLPKFSKDIDNYQKLAPTGQMLKYTQTEYEIEFDLILKRLSPEKVLEDLTELSDGKDIALICYEKEGDFCHRHIVADWISQNLNIPVSEYNKKQGCLCLF